MQRMLQGCKQTYSHSICVWVFKLCSQVTLVLLWPLLPLLPHAAAIAGSLCIQCVLVQALKRFDYRLVDLTRHGLVQQRAMHKTEQFGGFASASRPLGSAYCTYDLLQRCKQSTDATAADAPRDPVRPSNSVLTGQLHSKDAVMLHHRPPQRHNLSHNPTRQFLLSQTLAFDTWTLDSLCA